MITFENFNKKQENTINEQYFKDFVKFKMRAEAPIDVIKFLEKEVYTVSEYHVVDLISTTGAVVEFSSRHSLEELLSTISDIDDGHIMYRTLNYLNEYDGKDVRD